MSGRVLATAVVLLLGSAGVANAATPTLTAKPNAAGEVVVTWTLPAGHTSTNLHWSTDPSTVPTPATDPSEGLQMACFASGPSDGVHNCTGGTDLGDTQTSYTIKGLAPGTYYVQVMTYGAKQWQAPGWTGPLGVHYSGYSPVVQFRVSAASGSKPAIPTKDKSAPSAVGTVTVSGSGPVTVWRRGEGSGPVVTQVDAGTVKLGFDERILSGERALKLAIKEGRVVIAPHTQIGFLGAGEWRVYGAPKGKLDFYVGEAWFTVPKAPAQHRLLVDAGYATVVRTIGPATFTVRDTGPGVQVQVLSGKVQVGRGKADKKPVVLDAGFQLFHPIGDPIGKPTKFKPPAKPFWK